MGEKKCVSPALSLVGGSGNSAEGNSYALGSELCTLAMAVDRKLICEDLLGYLQNIPAVSLAKLYQHSASCLAVFRCSKKLIIIKSLY